MDEAHIKHAVGLVEHQNLHLAQIEHALLQQVEQAPGRGHQDVDAFFYARYLRVHANPAKYHGRGDLHVLAVGLHRLFNLRRQFAGGRQDQDPDAQAAKFVARWAVGAELVQYGQHKGRGFASAGLRPAQQVLPCKYGRNSLGLNRRWGDIALLEHSLEYGRGQIEFFKVHRLAPILGARSSACHGAWGTASVKGRWGTKVEPLRQAWFPARCRCCRQLIHRNYRIVARSGPSADNAGFTFSHTTQVQWLNTFSP